MTPAPGEASPGPRQFARPRYAFDHLGDFFAPRRSAEGGLERIGRPRLTVSDSACIGGVGVTILGPVRDGFREPALDDLTLAVDRFDVIREDLGFLKVADEVGEHETERFDRAVLLALRHSTDLTDPLGPAWVESIARDVTSLGSLTVLSLVVLATCGFLLVAGNRPAAAFVLAACSGGALLSAALKGLYQRSRPELIGHIVEVHTTSFPSGHAILSAVIYFTVGALIARVLARRSRRCSRAS
jgi:hypothetical protein